MGKDLWIVRAPESEGRPNRLQENSITARALVVGFKMLTEGEVEESCGGCPVR